MKSALRIAALTILISIGLVAGAQTSTMYNLQVPFNCGNYNSVSLHCLPNLITPAGNAEFYYNPIFNGNLKTVGFSGGSVDDLGMNLQVDSLNTTYNAATGMSEQTVTFHGATFTGTSVIQFTTKTACCSGGKGYHAAQSWTIWSGAVWIRQ